MLYLWMLFGAIAFGDEEEKEEKEEDIYAEEIEGKEKIEGLFPLYRDDETGAVLMEIRQSQLDKEFLYFSYTENGVVAAGAFRGAFRSTALIELEKYYDRIDFVAQNTHFYFDPESPLKRAEDSNISPSVLVSASIKATQEVEGDELYLIEFDPILLSEDLTRLEYSRDREGFSLGSLSEDRSRILALNNYERNTDAVVEYVFHKSKPKYGGGMEVTDARNVHITLQHSFIDLPESDYQPRFDDFRVGYFLDMVDDQTSDSFTPYRDMINRWNLVKKNPSAELSEPVKPIVWWMENTTPVEYRDAIKEGVLAWNKAFEKAGFKNAIVVKQQPDDAKWDAGDIRYNVLRWTASPRPPFGGYGPSFSNPRTGEIIGADIMLEYVYMLNRVDMTKLFSNLLSKEEKDVENCMHGAYLQANVIAGMSFIEAKGWPAEEKQRLLKEAIQHLVQHEVGHTLGLSHNMKSSSSISLEELHDFERAQKEGLVPSVMDYTPINLAPKGVKQGKFFSDVPGLYDHWAIEFGYTPSLRDPKAEAKRQKDLLAKSLEPKLTFGNDADDMRSAFGGIDPRTNVGDLSSDLVGWTDQQIEIFDSLQERIMDTFRKEGESWEGVKRGFYLARYMKVGALLRLPPLVGGIYVERGVTEQFVEGKQPLTPVSKEEQLRALDLLCEEIFADGALQPPAELIPYFQNQRRGFGFFGNSEDPKIHDQILNEQSYVLFRLLNLSVMQRLSDAQVYGGTMTAHDLIDRLTLAIFSDDRWGTISDERKNLQLYYVQDLMGLYSYLDRGTDSAAVAHGLRLAKSLSEPPIFFGGDGATRSHRKHIQKILKEW